MDDVKEAICRRLIDGESLRSICASDGMPSKSTVCLWLASDDEFRERYEAARVLQAHMLADEIIDISDDARNDWMDRTLANGTTVRVVDNEHVGRSKLRVDSRKWLAAKLAPKKYGDATLLKHGDADGNAITGMNAAEQALRASSLIESALGRAAKE